jgi:hypothetical protein
MRRICSNGDSFFSIAIAETTREKMTEAKAGTTTQKIEELKVKLLGLQQSASTPQELTEIQKFHRMLCTSWLDDEVEEVNLSAAGTPVSGSRRSSVDFAGESFEFLSDADDVLYPPDVTISR